MLTLKKLNENLGKVEEEWSEFPLLRRTIWYVLQ